MTHFVEVTLLTGFIQSGLTCTSPGTNLQSLWMEFPPFITRNTSAEGNPVTGALLSGLTSMLKSCCHSTFTISWEHSAMNARHLESSFSDEHDFALPVTRTTLFHTFTAKVPSWEYIPLVETPGNFSNETVMEFFTSMRPYRNIGSNGNFHSNSLNLYPARLANNTLIIFCSAQVQYC